MFLTHWLSIPGKPGFKTINGESIFGTGNIIISGSTVAWADITGKPTEFTPSAHTHPYLPLTGGVLSNNLDMNGNEIQNVSTILVYDDVLDDYFPIAFSNGTLVANFEVMASKAYVDNAVTGLLDDKGPLDCSTNPNYPVALKGDAYHVTVAGKVGGASGISVEIGDVVAASTNNAGGTQASVGTSWYILEHNLVGALVTGGALGTPASGTLTNCTGYPFANLTGVPNYIPYTGATQSVDLGAWNIKSASSIVTLSQQLYLSAFTHSFAVTTYSPANTASVLSYYSSNNGGALYAGIAKSNVPALSFFGMTDETAPTVAPIRFVAGKRSGTDTVAIGSTELAFQFSNAATGWSAGTTLLTINGAGVASASGLSLANTGATHQLTLKDSTGSSYETRFWQAANYNYLSYYFGNVFQRYAGVIRLDLGAWSIGHGGNPQAQIDVRPYAASMVGQVIRLAASQTANAFEVQNSSATVLTSISASGNIITSGWIDGSLKPYTVAGLPLASASTGKEYYVTDSTVAMLPANYGATVAGGGSNKCKVFSNGTNWVIA